MSKRIGPDNSYNTAITIIVREETKPNKDYKLLGGMRRHLKHITERWETK